MVNPLFLKILIFIFIFKLAISILNNNIISKILIYNRKRKMSDEEQDLNLYGKLLSI